MVLKFEFPDTGEGVTEGQFLEWLVDEGEEVEEDQTVAEVETDKAVVDVPAPQDGVIEDLKVEPGDKVEVGEVIMVMETGSPAEKEEDQEPGKDSINSKKEETGEKKSGTTGISSDSVLALPKVRKLASEENVELDQIEGSGPEGRITEEDVKAAASKKAGDKTRSTESTTDVKATPSVRKLAREKAVEIKEIEGTGRGGKVTREDVLSAAEEGTKDQEQKREEENTEGGEIERVEMSSIRKTVAERMEESRFTAPHVTHVEKADVTELVDLREGKKNEVDVHLTYLPFIMKAALVGLKEYPDLNAELDEENDEIVRKKYYDFNIAVDTEHGLMTPKIKEVDDKSIVELAQDIKRKAEAAKQRDLSPSQLRPGSFSLTNLGVIGGEEFTPIIEYPQVAILGIGKIQETAEVVDGEVKPRWTVKLSLSYDHRVVDGATAARFMNTVVENLEKPEYMLMEI